jgi:hypothetical protein
MSKQFLIQEIRPSLTTSKSDQKTLNIQKETTRDLNPSLPFGGQFESDG